MIRDHDRSGREPTENAERRLSAAESMEMGE
jgi:hypothetical protein